jgi:sugar lactone lactonase YvrE/predicted membrane-bound mannosyltransferase
MTVVAMIFFFDFLFAHHIADKMRAKSTSITPQIYPVLVILLLIGAPIIALAWPFIAGWRRQYELDEMPPEANLIVVMGTLALPQYASGIQLLPFFGKEWRNRAGENSHSHVASQEATVAVATIVALIGVAATLGLAWRPKTWLIAAACFWVPFTLLFTTFFANPPGFFSGAWGSMDYWISQQDVRRGNQPDYYYFITIPVYEFVPLALSLAAMAYYAIRGRLTNALFMAGGMLAILALLIAPPWFDVQKVSSLHVILPFTIVLIGIFSFSMDRVTRFLMFWLVITAFTLTIAGEKMPWLNVHIALPLAVLAGRFVGDMVEHSDLRADLPKLERLAPFMYVAIASALAVFVFVIVGPFSFASVGGWILALVAAIAVYWALTGYSRKTAMQVAFVGAVAAFSVFSLRAGLLASWGHFDSVYATDDHVATADHGDVPVEMLVYTQTSGDIPVLRDNIDKVAKQSGKGRSLPIVVDSADGFTWPWAWYLRDYKSVSYTSISANYQPPAGAVLLIGKDSVQNVQLGANYQQGIPYHHRRWFPEEYRGADGKYSTRDFFSDLFSIRDLKYWLDYWIRRTPPNSLGSVDGVAFFPKGADVIAAPPAGPTVRSDGTQLVIGGTGSANGQLSGPSDVAFDSSGNIYVADTGNGRIQKYDPQGVWQATAGGFTSSDPTLTLTQPWSMAVTSDGTVFVANTWNHSVTRLDKDLKKVKEWGSGCTTIPDCDEFHLFGPRDIAITADGHVLIADTGNNRLIEYDQDGNAVRKFGSKGTSGSPLEFNEPSSVVTAANGDMFVADFWNKRIVHLDKDLKSKGEIKVDSWGSTAVTDRAYLALLPDGRLLATDPTGGNVLVFAADGTALPPYTLPKESGQGTARPIGIATDGTSVVVADSAGNVVRKIVLTEIIK